MKSHSVSFFLKRWFLEQSPVQENNSRTKDATLVWWHTHTDTHDVSKQEVHYSAAQERSAWTFNIQHSVSQSTQAEDGLSMR